MYETGHSRHFDCSPTTSGPPLSTDIFWVSRHVSNVPKTEVDAFTRSLHRLVRSALARSSFPEAVTTRENAGLWKSPSGRWCSILAIFEYVPSPTSAMNKIHRIAIAPLNRKRVGEHKPAHISAASADEPNGINKTRELLSRRKTRRMRLTQSRRS